MIDLQYWKAEKKKKGLTIEQIAELSGIPKGSVQNIFAGYVRNPRIDTVQAIEKALGIGGNGITDDERAAGVVDNVTVQITAKEDIMLSLFRELAYKRGEEAQNAIITILENMLR